MTVDNNGVSVNAKDKGGLTVNGDGVSVTTDNATIKVDAEGKVSAVTGTITEEATPSVNAADENKLATAGNVAKAINAAKTAVTNADNTTVVELADDGKTYKVAAKVADNKGLEKTTDGLTVKAGTGVTVDNNGVSVNAKTNGGITVDASGVSVNAKANGGIKVDGEGVSVDADGKTIEVGADGKVTAKVASAKGLEKTDDGLAIKSKTNGGLTVDTDGVSVKTDGTTIEVDTATGNVKAVTGGFTTNTTTGATEANKNDANKLATVGNVANAINAAKVNVVAGNGAEVAHDAKTNTYTVSAKVEGNKGLENKTEGLSVKAGEGVTVDDKGVSVKSKANGGITVGADGVSVQNGNGITVGANGVSVNAKTGGGITVDANGVSVNAKDKGGLTVNGDGVSVTTDNATIKVDDEGKVSAVTGTITAGATPSVATGDANKLATAGNVAKAINAAKVKVEAGSGISVAHNAALNTYTVSAPFEKTENDRGTTVTFKGKTTTEHPNGETKLSGIAAGDISPTSSDAVNGAQIYGLNRGATTKVENVTVAGNTYNNVIVSNDGKNTPLLKTYNTQDKRTVLTNSVYEAIYNMNEYGIKFFHVNDGTANTKREGYSENDSSASGKYATAIGALSDASGQNAVAMGFGSTVTGDNSIAIGTGNQVNAAKSGAFGDPNIINGKDVNNVAVSGSYAVGNDNIIDSSNTFVLGNDINNKGNSTPVGHTVENSVYLGNKTTARGGDGSQTAALKNIKHDGSEGTTTTAGSIGTVNEAIVNGMSYGGFAGAKGHGVVSVGAADAERRIQNVAAGEISATSTDAINGSQLYSISSRLGNNMNSLNDRINKVGKRADAGTASAIATANLLQSYRPGLSAATAAVGQYRGQSAVAVGYSRLSDNGKYGVKFSLGANTQGNVGAGAGVAYFW